MPQVSSLKYVKHGQEHPCEDIISIIPLSRSQQNRPQTDTAVPTGSVADCLEAWYFLQSGLCLSFQSLFWQAGLQ